MKHKLKLKGKLQTYLQLSMLLGILLAVVDIWIYTLDIKAGVVLSGFVLRSRISLHGDFQQLLCDLFVWEADQVVVGFFV